MISLELSYGHFVCSDTGLNHGLLDDEALAELASPAVRRE